MDPIKNIFIDTSIQSLLRIGVDISYPTIETHLAPSYSQTYEDIIIESLIRKICISNNYILHELSYIEIGANNPISTSNTYLFYTKYGMTGILVEPNRWLCEQLRAVRHNDKVINKAIVCNENPYATLYISNKNEISSIHENFISEWVKISNNPAHVDKVEQVEACRINSIFTEINKPVAILSIDVEGLDKEILLDLDTNYFRPFTIVIEPSDFFIENNAQNIISLMKDRDYGLIAITDVNLIFKDNKLL